VKVKISKQHLKIDLIESNGTRTLLDSDLAWPVRAEDSTWSLVPGEHIHVVEHAGSIDEHVRH
jgi:hypothetical protein